MSSKPVVRAKVQRKAIQESDLGFVWGAVNMALMGLGVATLVAGYVSLSRGSITLAPILLVLGYCVLIPASLLIRSRKGSQGE
jgi:hypothetical protein